MGTKICTKCKNEFPHTEEYFYKKIKKQKLSNGSITIYTGLRSLCKKCNGRIGNELRVKKRCLTMGCDVSEYRENWKNQYSETRTHFKEITHLPKGVQSTLRKKMQDGYVYEGYEKYKIECSKNYSKVRRKYDYGDLDFVPKNTQTGIKYLTDGYVALTLGRKMKEVPKEMIETKRLIIQLKRELNNNLKIN